MIQLKIVGVEEMRQRNRSLPRLDLFDSRYNSNYLEAIELFLEAKYYDAALCLIDRTRFRSGCDALEGTRVFGSPIQHDALSLPVVDKNELILMLWIYPKYSWVFPITHESKKLTPKKVITTTRKGPPLGFDLNTE